MKKVSIYTTIFVLAAFASIFQLSSLGNGLSATVANSQELTATPVTPVTPTITPVKTLSAFTPERVVISSVEIDLPIFSVPLKDGTWEVLPHVANFAEGTSLVNAQEGNVGLFANDRLDGFTRIQQLDNDAAIIVYGNGQKATYKVTSSRDALATDTNVFAPTKTPILTLVTSDEIFSNKQHIVKAELVKIEAAN